MRTPSNGSPNGQRRRTTHDAPERSTATPNPAQPSTAQPTVAQPAAAQPTMARPDRATRTSPAQTPTTRAPTKRAPAKRVPANPASPKRAGGAARAAADTGQRGDLYAEVTNRIIAELEAGRFPWVQPWRGAGGGTAGATIGLPRNAATSRPYSGINVLILWGAVIAHGYSSQGWLTFRQAIDAGGCVRKGEHGVTVVYADRFVPRDNAGAGGTPIGGPGHGTSAAPVGGAGGDGAGKAGDPRAIPFLKRFTVFNVAQCDGLRADLAADPVPLPAREIVPVGEAVIAASGVDFRIGGASAFYAPGPDFVQVPPQPAFFDQINYYRTALHELTHATGHSTRLGRQLLNAFGTKDYAREELVAELGAAFLCAALGIVPTVRHADYLAGWLDLLREDKRAIFKAASAASRAADWLLTRHRACAATDPGPAQTASGPGQGPDASAADQLPPPQPC